jgi:hypothetical protein
MYVNNPSAGTVSVYVGGLGIANTQISASPNGNVNDFTTPFNIPAGQSVYVQWTSLPTPVSSAYATMSCVRET